MNRTTAHRLNALKGLIAGETGERLYELAREVPAHLTVVEIGSFKGKSSCYLGQGVRDGHGAQVHCIEPWDLEGNTTGKHGFAEPGVYEIWRTQVATQGLTSYLYPHRAFSHQFAQRWLRPLGLLFIDGSHEYEDVKQDAEDWVPFLVSRGTVVFDDYVGRNVGVKRYVDELRPKLTDWDFNTPPLAIARKQ